MAIKVAQAYAKLSRQALLDKANELGYNFVKNSGSCSQSTVAALHEILCFDPMLTKAATSLCGGTAIQHLGTCGALAGGIMVLDYYTGRPPEKMSYHEHVQENTDLLEESFVGPKLLAERFIRKYGTILCPQLERNLYGRIYYGADPDEARKKKARQELIAPNDCFGIVGDVSRWVMEILLERQPG